MNFDAINAITAAWAPRVLAMLRIMTGLVFMQAGTMKLFGFPPPANPGPARDFLALGGGLHGLGETVGGALIVLGLFTQPVAFLLSGEMAFAYFMSHWPRSFFPILNNGDRAVLFCFTFLYFAFVGGGVWSLDAMRRKSPGAA